jgi:hypothetical protein
MTATRFHKIQDRGKKQNLLDRILDQIFRHLISAKLRIFSKQLIRPTSKLIGLGSLLKQIFSARKHSNQSFLQELSRTKGIA